jgi:polysaccharide export outer membrane protein
MNIRYWIWLPVFILVMLASCDRYPTIPDSEVIMTPPQTVSQAPIIPKGMPMAPSASEDYKIGAEDILEVKVWGHEDLTRDVQVSQTGEFTFPFIGKVKAAGRTTAEVEKEITNRLKSGYLVDPQVSVAIKEYRSQKVYVVGEVKTPGTYLLTGPTSVVEILSRAGGPTQLAGNEVLVIRPRGQESKEGPIKPEEARPEEVIQLDRRALQGGNVAHNIPLMDGDTVVVSKADYFYVLGEVRNPGQFVYQDGLTVIKAITIAGGFTDKAAAGRTRIIREKHGVRKEMQITMTAPVEPNDMVMVPESFF